MAPFVVIMLLIILPGLKGDCLGTCPSPLMQNDNLRPRLSLVVVLRGNENGEPPFLFVFFTRYGNVKNPYQREKSG